MFYMQGLTLLTLSKVSTQFSPNGLGGLSKRDVWLLRKFHSQCFFKLDHETERAFRTCGRKTATTQAEHSAYQMIKSSSWQI